MDLDFLLGKKVAIAGFGREGRSVLSFLLKAGIAATVLDKKEDTEVPPGVKSIVGKDYLKDLENFEIVFRSPGIPILQPEFKQARRKGAVVTSPTQLFFDLCPCPIVGVTGTKGKGTCARLIFEILRQAGKKTFLGGNIGNPPLDFLNELKENSIVVLELSSFQLQDLGRSPHIAVLLNATRDHLDYHKTREEYIQAKSEIFLHQKRDDYAVLNADDEAVKMLSLKAPSRKRWFSREIMSEPGAYCLEERLYLNLEGEKEICTTSELKVLGPHNVSNVLAGMLAAALAGATISAVRKAVKSYKGLENHRLEKAGARRGILFINDSAATMPDAALAALEAFPQQKILIAGGSDKKAEFTAFARGVKEKDVKAVFLLGTTGQKIADELKKAGFSGRIEFCANMEDAVAAAFAHASPGDVVLLSPASASFGLFHNYQERGDRFKKIVSSLPE